MGLGDPRGNALGMICFGNEGVNGVLKSNSRQLACLVSPRHSSATTMWLYLRCCD